MTSAQSALLNIDLLYIIFSNFEYQDDLFNGLLVHSYWALAIIDKLWKKPTWKSYNVFQKFIRTLRSSSTTSFNYGHFVQQITFASYSSYYPEISIPISDVKILSEKCKNIKHLTFNRVYSAETIEMFLVNCPGLITFAISGHKLPSLGDALRPIRDGKCSKLQHLELSNWRSEWKHDILRDVGNRCPLLTTLITSCLVTNTLATTIVNSFPNLKSFRCNNITGAGFTILTTGCSKLKCLSLEFPYLSSETALAVAIDFPPLESFSLRFGSYSGFEYFARLWVQGQPYLQHIELDSAYGLSDDSFLPIARYCHQLESVEIRSCTSLSDCSIMALAKYRNNKLKRFTIMHCNQLTDLGLSDLAENCKNLRKCTIFGCLNITHLSLTNIVKNCKRLQEFGFTNRPRMTPTIVTELIKNNYESFLEVLDIRSDDLATADSTVNKPCPKFDLNLMESLAEKCHNIRTLGLRFNMIGLSPDELIQVTHKFHKLEILTIGSKEFKKEHIKELEIHSRLKEVKFVGNSVLDQDARIYLVYRKSKERYQGPFITSCL
ncbi:7542_t:CDS:2 [Funneliformis geosporum]|uniref:12126_t:CDS:1 n=1 Tax=Funneliformis geosporum TaxID=1117311 RepID=A0A9W4SFE6_9GLOM|nr:12126_t:CDS:2 [Funneliformis geosporum]CAI2168285.1 7542_t:CDS:2 [Funneliformis geosporum]